MWDKIKTEYITDESASYRKLCEKYKVSFTTLSTRAKTEGWVELRKQYKDKTTTKTVEKLSAKQADKLSRVLDLTDKLLDKLEQAIEELDTQLYKHITKTKEIEYNNDLRPDKPTKETIHEEEKVIEVKTIVDRGGLKAIASSLRDIKEVQMLRSELDRQEQEARIANLRRQSEADQETNDITVTILGDLNEYSK